MNYAKDREGRLLTVRDQMGVCRGVLEAQGCEHQSGRSETGYFPFYGREPENENASPWEFD
jgi:hypothetical protein